MATAKRTILSCYEHATLDALCWSTVTRFGMDAAAAAAAACNKSSSADENGSRRDTEAYPVDSLAVNSLAPDLALHMPAESSMLLSMAQLLPKLIIAVSGYIFL